MTSSHMRKGCIAALPFSSPPHTGRHRCDDRTGCIAAHGALPGRLRPLPAADLCDVPRRIGSLRPLHGVQGRVAAHHIHRRCDHLWCTWTGEGYVVRWGVLPGQAPAWQALPRWWSFHAGICAARGAPCAWGTLCLGPRPAGLHAGLTLSRAPLLPPMPQARRWR